MAEEGVMKSRLKHRREIAEGTMAFVFERPAGFEFRAGQSVDLTLVDPPATDDKGNTRAYSIASPPSDGDLTIATRMRDTAFKRVLKTAPLGLEVQLAGPFGSFTLHKKVSRPAVLLAGGIGITPFFSMASEATRTKLSQDIFLFYSNRRPEDAAFLPELQQLAVGNPHLHLVATMTAMDKSARPWTGQTGVINPDLLRRHVADPASATFYIAGPAAMVAAMRQILTQAAVDEDDIRTEEFSGY